MGFRFQRRLNYGAGLGLNLSKSGASPSFRSKAGAISMKGFSIRTGIRGLSFRKSWGKGPEGAIIGLMAMVVILGINIVIMLISVGLKVFFILAWLAISIGWFLVALVFNITAWSILTTYDFVKYLNQRERNKKKPRSDE